MTNILTLIRPEGIWQSADHRVTKGGKIFDDAASKQIHIVCLAPPDPPSILLGFTGLAEMTDGKPTLQWVRETLNGEPRTVNQTFEYLAKRLTEDVSMSKYGNYALVLTGGIFWRNKCFRFAINNYASGLKIRNKFDYLIEPADKPSFYVDGSSQGYETKEDVELVLEQIQKRPSNWKDHMGLLASINRKIAARTSSVSPWCQASFIASDTGGVVYGQQFRKPGEPKGPEVTLDTILLGIDTHPMSVQSIRVLAAIKRGAA